MSLLHNQHQLQVILGPKTQLHDQNGRAWGQKILVRTKKGGPTRRNLTDMRHLRNVSIA